MTKLSRHYAREDPELFDRFEHIAYCRCGARMGHERHDVPQPDDAVLAEEARRLGEHEVNR